MLCVLCCLLIIGRHLQPQKIYGELNTHQTAFLTTLGRENRELDIIIFKEVLDNMARVDRVLTYPGGSLLMAGRSGVGRRTAVTLVAFMHQMQLFSPKVSRNYGDKQFKADLKTVRSDAAFFFHRNVLFFG